MAAQSVASKALLATGWLFLWRVVTRALGFLSTLVLARLLVPADFGLVALATSFAATLDALAQFRLSDVLVRRIEDNTALHNVVFTLQFLRALVTGLIIAGSAPIAGSWFSDPRLVPVLWLLAAITVLSGLDNIGIVEFQRTLSYRRQVQLLAAPRLLQVVATVGVAWITQSYWALLAGIAVTRISRLIMSYVMHPFRPRLSLRGWEDVIGFSFWLWLTSLAQLAWEQAPTLIVGSAFGPALLGIFRIGAEVSLLPLSEIVGPVAQVLLASLSMLQRSGARPSSVGWPVALALVALTMPLALALSAGAGFAVNLLLGYKWLDAQPLVAIASWICIVSPLAYVAGAALTAEGRVRSQFIAGALAALVQGLVIYGASRWHQLTVVCEAWAACVAFEGLIFARLMGVRSGAEFRLIAGGLGRICLAGLMAAAAVRQTGIAWLPASYFVGSSQPPLRSIVCLLVIGILSVLVFHGTLFLAWWVCGQPEGPEKLLFRKGRDALAELRQTWQPSRWRGT